MKKALKVLLFLAITAMIVIGGMQLIKKKKAEEAQTPKAKVYPIVAKTIVPKLSQLKLTLPYLAIVQNDKDVMLSSRIAARITTIEKSGTFVHKGDVVAILDTTNIQSSLSSVQNQINAVTLALANLNHTHARTVKLLNVQGASVEQSQKELTMIAATEAKLAGLKQHIIALKNNLSYARIISPVEGVIAKSMGNPGTMSMPGKPLIQISAKNGFYLMVRVPTDVHISSVVFNQKEYPATPLGNTFHGLAEYKVFIGNAHLTNGDRIEVDVVTYEGKGTLLPFDAILNRDGKSYILVDAGGRAQAKEVHILKSAEQGVMVSEALENKKIVVAKPDILLKLTSGYSLNSYTQTAEE